MDAARQKYTITRHQPSDELRHIIQRYWIVRWDLRGQAPYRQVVLSHPNINMVFEPGNTKIYGISKATSSRLLQGHGCVLGVKFKPGGFYPYWNKPVSQLTDRSVGFSEVFGDDVRELEKELFTCPTEEWMVQRIERFFCGRLPQPDDKIGLVQQLVDLIMEDRTMTRVDDLVAVCHLSKRTLQRLFDRYVGVNPKWVIKRYRLHEAAGKIERGEMDWVRLALDLGYYDQAHFIKDFKALIGQSPEQYVAETAKGQSAESTASE